MQPRLSSNSGILPAGALATATETEPREFLDALFSGRSGFGDVRAFSRREGTSVRVSDVLQPVYRFAQAHAHENERVGEAGRRNTSGGAPVNGGGFRALFVRAVGVDGTPTLTLRRGADLVVLDARALVMREGAVVADPRGGLQSPSAKR